MTNYKTPIKIYFQTFPTINIQKNNLIYQKFQNTQL